MKSILLALFSVVALAPSAAQDRDFIVGGVGALPCAVATEGYEQPGVHDRIENLVAVSWAQGLISALNVAELPATKSYANLSSLAPQEQLNVLAVWYRDHPKEMFLKAALHLRTSLGRKAEQ